MNKLAASDEFFRNTDVFIAASDAASDEFFRNTDVFKILKLKLIYHYHL